jgi:hypothetical protein
MRIYVKSIVLIFLAFFCLAMGGNAKEVVSSIPDPDREFAARIVDKSDTAYEVDLLSIDGFTYLPANLGHADVAIDFGRIRSVDFYMQGDTELAVVRFADDSEKRFYLDPETVLYARSKWGNLRLTCRDVKSIAFKEKN